MLDKAQKRKGKKKKEEEDSTHRQRQSHKMTRPTHGDGLALPEGIPSVRSGRIHRAVAFLIDWATHPVIRVYKSLPETPGS